MKRFGRKSNMPMGEPVKKIEVSDSHRTLKIWLVVLLAALGITLIVTSIVGLVKTNPGWTTISADQSVEESCSGDFVFQYLLGQGDQPANFEQRDVTKVYAQAAKDAYQIFHAEQSFPGVNNVLYLNQHVNEAVQVPQALYEAFEMLEEYENRAIFLAPVYREYIGLFLSSDDYVAQAYDPSRNPGAKAYFEEVLTFTGSEEMIRLELLGDHRVKLCVSEDYLQFAQKNGITAYVDFYWMKNAFIADYLAQELTEAGYTNGILSSFDGFHRNLDTTDRSYRLNLFDRVGNDVYPAAVMEYSNVSALVTLRNYPTSALGVQLYYQWQDGSYTSCHIDPADGRSKSAINDLLGYSKTLGCAEILMQLYPVYVAEMLDEAALPSQGVETIYCKDYEIYASDASAAISQLYEKDNIVYRMKKG